MGSVLYSSLKALVSYSAITIIIVNMTVITIALYDRGHHCHIVLLFTFGPFFLTIVHVVLFLTRYSYAV